MLNKKIEDFDLSELVKVVNNAEKGKKDTCLKVAILRNITIDPIIHYIKYLCLNEGVKLDVYMGEYNNIFQDILVPESLLYKKKPDIIIICLKLEMLSAKISNDFIVLNQNEINEEIASILGNVNLMLSSIRNYSNSMVLVHNFEVPIYPCYGIYDYQNCSSQLNTLRKLNLQVVDIVTRHKNCYIVDIDVIQSYVGYKDFIDNRFWHIGMAPYSREAYIAIAKEYIKFIRAKLGINRKCLVLDCDNTLWGGIIGEDGIDGIKLGRSYPGSAYLEFQQSILDLYNRGVILAISSKNNKDDVLEVLNNHPDMVLREEHFAIIKADWSDKVSNIKEIAEGLNIGLDSMVFVDDSDFEANMVNEYLPEVKVVNLPKDPTVYRDTLNSYGLFDSLAVSEEDGKRGKMYKTELGRKRLKSESINLESYFTSLEMEIVIGNPDSFLIPRVAQLTQRTNQFNLTTKRYLETDIDSFVKSDNHEVKYLKLKDRFGDMGLVGVAILEYKDDTALIDSFLMSCRIIGRCVEDVFLHYCIKCALEKGMQEIYGYYLKTKKNSQVSDFYQKRGFEVEYLDDNEMRCIFSLNNPIMEIPDYFKTIKYT
jgi:FkbH-like protein